MRSLVLLTLYTFLGACDAGVAPESSAQPPAGKGDLASRTYRTVDGEPFPAADHAQITAALDELARVAVEGTSGRQRRLAETTLARIEAGDVVLGLIPRARGVDLWHMCKDMGDRPECAGESPPTPDWAGSGPLLALITLSLDGYQWGNRLYFAFNEETTPSVLSITLVHEVNHALNRSECSYYRDLVSHEVDPALSFVEEYRAFIAECVHRRGSGATVARCDAWANRELVDRGYDIPEDFSLVLDAGESDTSIIARSLFADDGRFGWLAAEASRWPLSFSSCATPRFD
jgi:hypothetical protein